MKNSSNWLGWVGAGLLVMGGNSVVTKGEVDSRAYAVEVSARVTTAPAQIQLGWPADTNASGYTVFRKSPEGSAWTAVGNLAGDATNYLDDGVTIGSSFEYHIRKTTTVGRVGHGYALAGINAPMIEDRGKVILVVDNTYAAALAVELARLEQDLAGDGWTVVRRDISPTLPVTTVKALIKAEYNADPGRVNSVFLFGHVPVPRSGDINPDGHADHKGAWAADTYYADMDGLWTDASVNTTAAERSDNYNVPGDGRFDQGALPSDLELAVGRVDLSNLTCFSNKNPSRSELDLLRQYLNKDHNFRHGLLNLPRRGLVCDNFGEAGGEAYGANGWRAFAAMFGAEINYAAPYGTFFSTLNSEGFLWSYGAGGGGYYTCDGVGGADDFALNDIKTSFLMFFGSYFGDWDNESNFLRAALGSSSHTLTVSWTGRPHWFYHRMALGEPIGVSARLSQNNYFGGVYEPQNYGTRSVSSALLGDPTLRMHPVAPPSNLMGAAVGPALALSWSGSSDPEVLGYSIYRSASPKGPFTRITPTLIRLTQFADLLALSNGVYMVRAVKLETSGSGAYYNPSQGAFFTNGVVSGIPPPPPPTTGTNSALFVKLDASTGGTWKGLYGSEGNWVYSAAAEWPAYALVTPASASEWIWNESAADPAATMLPGATTNRVAACWYSFNPFAMNIELSDGKAHLLSAYFLDWDESGRQTRVEMVDGDTGAILNTQMIGNFANGIYLTWQLQGRIQMRLIPLAPAGGNAVISALFLDAPAGKPAARWIKADHLTKGNWRGVYGADGGIVAGEGAVYPNYASVAISGKSDVLWTNGTTEARALMKINGTERIAAEWLTSSNIFVDVNFTDGLAHQAALYCVDWPRLNRGIVIDVLDGETGKVINSQDLGNYNEGKYFIWEVESHVKFRVRRYGASTSVSLSGIFFGPASGPL